MSQAVNFGANPTTGVAERILTDGAGRMQVSVSYSGTSPVYSADNADGVATTSTANRQIVASRGYVYNGTTWDRQKGDTNGAWGVATGSAAAAVGIVPITAKNANSLLLKNSPGNFYGASIVAGAAAGYLIAYNAVAAPGAGAALTAALILGAVPVAANGVAALGDYAVPDRFSVGIVLLFSTNLDTFTAPGTAALLLRGKDM